MQIEVDGNMKIAESNRQDIRGGDSATQYDVETDRQGGEVAPYLVL